MCVLKIAKINIVTGLVIEVFIYHYSLCVANMKL